jgi:hypothetical protein
MAERGSHQYPPVGDTDRLDAILRRGRSLRRRRQLGVGAGGTMAAVAVVAVLVTAWPAGSSTDGGLADDPTTTIAPTTTLAPTIETMQVTIDASATPIEVTVEDPAQPVPLASDVPAEQCVLVTLYRADGSAAAEGTACKVGADETVVELTFIPPGGPQIGCAAIAVRIDPSERATTADSSRFELALPDELPSGTYRVEVQASSGIGDRCPTIDSPDEDENQAQATETIEVP